jgi:4-amino-4-deoxychorismate lyase
MENPFREAVPDGLEVVETLGWHPDNGMRHLPLHIARMAQTAEALGFRFDADIAASLLRGVASLMPLRCRMALNGGGLTLTTSVQPPNPDVWRVGIAAERLTSGDPWLQHKTTNRGLYDQLRADLPKGQDEWLFLNERDEVCEGTITNIFATLADGTKVTPPLTCGLLPGILRQTLLGTYAERVLSLDDLAGAQVVYMGNALRGLIPVEIIGIA